MFHRLGSRRKMRTLNFSFIPPSSFHLSTVTAAVENILYIATPMKYNRFLLFFLIANFVSDFDKRIANIIVFT